MNKAFRIIKNRLTGATVVAHEFAKGHGGGAVKKNVLSIAVLGALGLASANASAGVNGVYSYSSVNGATVSVVASDNNSYSTGFAVGDWDNNNQIQVLSASANTISIGAGARVYGSNFGIFQYQDNGVQIQAGAASDNLNSLIDVTVDANVITNNGAIDSYNTGILIAGYAEGGHATVSASGNTITNAMIN